MGSTVKVQPPGDRKEVIFYEKTHFLSVQDGGKTGEKTGIKLAYKHAFAPVFTSDGHTLGGTLSDASCPALAGQEDVPS